LFTTGEGAVSSYSRKVKLNTRNSTKMELVVADMYMPEMLWSLYLWRVKGMMWNVLGCTKTIQAHNS
jgi:hypothetical protein